MPRLHLPQLIKRAPHALLRRRSVRFARTRRGALKCDGPDDIAAALAPLAMVACVLRRRCGHLRSSALWFELFATTS